MKTNFQFMIFTLFPILAFIACNKNNTIIEGYVLEIDSERPIENAIVPIERWYSTTWPNGGYIGVEDVYTDKNGYFKWESDFEPESGWFKIGTVGHEK